MQFTVQQLALLASILPTVHSHGFVIGATVGKTWYPGFDIQLAYQANHPKVYGWDTKALDSGFVSPDSFATADIICHKSATPAGLHIPVTAGGQVTLYWSNSWPEGHQGPVLDYLAACPNNDCSTVTKTDLNFAKIDQVGLVSGSSPGYWGEDQLAVANRSWTVTIPSSLAAGAYVLRHEILALHSARSANGAQAYPQCVNLMVSGGGSATVKGSSPETFYSATDPGILIDIYNNAAGTYQIPGPTVQAFGGSGGSAPASSTTLVTSVRTTTTTAKATTTTAPPVTTTTTKAATTTTTKAATTTTSAAGGSASLYAQCGGQGWTGPTTCASGTCKAQSQYYSQCLP
ncbi:hypothetical protein LTR95_002826 [Oleoguttula sp. CCFEE 5521]|uniref:AA9 family lytic polysaccharide monooxygenase n=1 Tax=Cryoendolithus antarcticus TaxID=1507870 RepID=A0A1V8T7F6_9PEZI|nr:hypothetical protein B0A48_07761 [Cryoendolithus antarcticus]